MEAFSLAASFALCIWLGLNVNCLPVAPCEGGSAVGRGAIFGTVTSVEGRHCGWALKVLSLSGSSLSLCFLTYQDVNKSHHKFPPLRMVIHFRSYAVNAIKD